MFEPRPILDQKVASLQAWPVNRGDPPDIWRVKLRRSEREGPAAGPPLTLGVVEVAEFFEHADAGGAARLMNQFADDVSVDFVQNLLKIRRRRG